MASSFDNFPKGKKLRLFNSSILVYVYLVEKLCGGNLSKACLPVLQGFSLVNLIATVVVENREDFMDFGFEGGRQLLWRVSLGGGSYGLFDLWTAMSCSHYLL